MRTVRWCRQAGCPEDARVYPVFVAPDPITRTQLDRLGARLREGSANDADIHALDNYRRSFRGAFEAVVSTIASLFGSEATGRPAKTTSAIVEKLRRQKIRLTQIQDIAGVRLVVGSVAEQDQVVAALRQAFLVTHVDDRRVRPSHGYRAVHVIVVVQDRMVEIQVRTEEQHRWAEVSEKMADVVDPTIKYGGGPEDARRLLDAFGELVVRWEALEQSHRDLLASGEECRALARTIEDTETRKSLEARADEGEAIVARDTAEAKQSAEDNFAALMASIDALKRTKGE